MSVDNFDGDGFADQPSIVYSFETDETGEVTIRELSRSGYGEPGPSPGDVIERDTTKSTLDDSLPELDLPGEQGLAQDDCGEDIPAFACLDHEDDGNDGCGNSVYVGRSCASPVCERDWPAGVKDKVTRTAGKLEGLRRALYARYDGRKDIDFNHVVASLPSLLVDSENPLKRALLIIKTLLEEHWDIDGFVAIFHPYRIKKEYRKDQYEHGGESGEGDMTWADVLSVDPEDRGQYIKFEPHFHTFFPAPRRSFDYSVAEAVQEQSGWLFHRITKGKDSNVSVKNLDDLVNQLTYTYSHAGVMQNGDRWELASRMKGDLHNCYAPDGIEDQVLASFCDAAPKLLGVKFANMNEATCGADLSESADSGEPESGVGHDHDRENHPLHDIWESEGSGPVGGGGDGDPWGSGALDAGTGEGDGDGTEESVVGQVADSGGVESPEAVSQEDTGQRCQGTLRPMREASERLDDEEWCAQAEYVDGLRTAFKEWERLADDTREQPWDDSDSDVVQTD